MSQRGTKSWSGAQICKPSRVLLKLLSEKQFE
jgi:hypothetical protein